MSTIPKDITALPHQHSDSHVSLDDFLRLYADMEDGFKYEWNNGKIEKTTKMNQTQFYIIKILMNLFYQTKVQKDGGLFVPEGDMYTSKTQYRIPDLAIYYASQELDLINNKNQIAPWVGEIISPTDVAERINTKLIEYFAAGVKVVWHIYPASEQVHVFTSLDDITICRGKRICSAKPALEDFEISADAIFAYKKHLKKEA